MAQRELRFRMREKTGKGPSKKMRRDGWIPAVLYGPGASTVSLSLSIHELKKVLVTRAMATTLLSLVAEGDGGSPVSGKVALLKDVQIHPLTRLPLHVDLYEVSMERKLSVKVPVRLTGKPAGVTEGGILQQVTREILIECLPVNIPQEIEADVSALKIGQSLHVRDVSFPEGVRSKADAELTLAAVVAPITEEEVKAMEAAAAAPPEAAQPEVVGKEKGAEVPEAAEGKEPAPEAPPEKKKSS